MTSPISAIPGISALYAVFSRHIDRENKVLARRQDLAKEVCETVISWSQILEATFRDAVADWESLGKEAARDRIVSLMHDYLQLPYKTVKKGSPTLTYLGEDKRFSAFAGSAADFYTAAIDLKQLVYGRIERSPGKYLVANSELGYPSKAMVTAWMSALEWKCARVLHEYERIRTLEPS